MEEYSQNSKMECNTGDNSVRVAGDCLALFIVVVSQELSSHY